MKKGYFGSLSHNIDPEAAMRTIAFCLAMYLSSWVNSAVFADSIDLTRATVVIRHGDLPAAEKIAPVILTDEIAKRTGVKWAVTDKWPADAATIIALRTNSAPPGWKDHIPSASSSVPGKPEGFAIDVYRTQEGGRNAGRCHGRRSTRGDVRRGKVASFARLETRIGITR